MRSATPKGSEPTSRLRAWRARRTRATGVRRSRGRVLLTAALACIVCGLVGTASILLTPRPAISSAPSVDVSDLEPGSFKFARHPVEGPAGSAFARSDILLIRRDDGAIVAYNLPLKDGLRHASNGDQALWPCRRIDVVRRVIECESEGNREHRISRWDLAGRGITPTWSKLGAVTGHEESGMFLLHP
jgi:hypothetical protein